MAPPRLLSESSVTIFLEYVRSLENNISISTCPNYVPLTIHLIDKQPSLSDIDPDTYYREFKLARPKYKQGAATATAMTSRKRA